MPDGDSDRALAPSRAFPNSQSLLDYGHDMIELTRSRWFPLVLLVVANVFMTFAWYGHLKYKAAPLWIVILVSWGIAFFEYILQVPANRWGSSIYSTTELKIIQEVVTLCVFSVFAVIYVGEKIRWNHFMAFLCILAAVAFTFMPKNGVTKPKQEALPQETAR
jgi:uncharacterized protein (DUF486 family)